MDLLKTILVSVSLLLLVFYGCVQKGEVVGNDSDAHGCKGSAGYTWCEEKQKCLRSWEEKCESPLIVGNDSDEHGCKASAGYSWCDVKQKCIRPWEENCTSENLVGNDTDDHGCIPSAGYSWCEEKQKCLRSWEENCTEAVIVGNDSDAHGCKASAGYSWCDLKSKCVRQWEEPCEGVLTLDEAREIARNSSSCMIQSDINEEFVYNNITKTWWLGMMAYKPGCDPACVVDETKRTASLNWRCTGGMPTYTIKTMDAMGGLILTDGRGRSLYLFSDDSINVSTCSGQCSQSFPPFVAPSTIVAPDTISGSIGILQRADSNIQVTYNGMPLYYYAADVAFGDVKGDGANQGKWSLARP